MKPRPPAGPGASCRTSSAPATRRARSGNGAGTCAGEHGLGARAVSWSGISSADPRVVTVPAGEERQAVHMVPVQVGEQDGAVNGVAVQQGVTRRRPCRRRGSAWAGRAVAGNGDAGRVAAVAEELGAGRWSGAADPAEVEAHRAQPRPASSRRCPRTAPPAPTGRTGGVQRGHAAGVTATSVEVRAPPSRAPAPRASPRARTRRAARRRAPPGSPRRGRGRRRCPAPPGARARHPAGNLAILGLAAPCISRADSVAPARSPPR